MIPIRDIDRLESLRLGMRNRRYSVEELQVEVEKALDYIFRTLKDYERRIANAETRRLWP